jgi:hypothetical protein
MIMPVAVTTNFEHYGRNLSDESLARLWQSGPKALRRSSTRAYGKRVMRELERRTVNESLTVHLRVKTKLDSKNPIFNGR